jgi:hypothetical protein
LTGTRRPNVGDVVQVNVANAEYAYARVLRDAAVAFYRTRSKEPGRPPIGSRDFEFIVRVYDDVLVAWPVVGRDPSRNPDEDWPPPASVTDPITKRLKHIYERGQMRPPEPGEDATALEPAAVWEQREVLDRLTQRIKTN